MLNLDKIIRFKPTGIKLEKGKYLVSSPLLQDFFFKRSIIIMTEYGENEVMGFIINKETDLKVSDLMEDFPDSNLPLYAGGPVQTDSLFMLHNLPDLILDSTKIKGDLFMGGNFNQIKDLLAQKILLPTEIRFYIGYSGWDYQQLEEELQKESWIISDQKNSKFIFTNNSNDIWKTIIQSYGQRYQHWLNMPENPSDN